jgi:hypothetical protein
MVKPLTCRAGMRCTLTPMSRAAGVVLVGAECRYRGWWVEYSVSAGEGSAEDGAVTHDRSTPAEQRPYDAVARWDPAVGGGAARRAGIDSLRLAVVPVPDDSGGGFQVEVYVNGTEMTSAGAGLGMDPYDLIVPTNRLLATPRPRTVPIARCSCGVYGCGSTDVVIHGDGDLVHWDWLIEVPMARRVSFSADRYSAEVERVVGDHSWETAERTAGRFVLTHLDREALLVHGLVVSWVANDHRDPGLFRVALRLDDDYQIFVDIPWRDRGPEELAEEVGEILGRGPGKWRASWHAIKPSLPGPPAIARRSWRQEHFR